jgi:D-psicose/D-tagatose/L-ribulose 3-epimerase
LEREDRKEELQVKIGVSAFAWTTNFNLSHLGLLPSVREHGIEVFEFPMFDPAVVPAAYFRRAFEANDLECTVCAILPTGINPISPDASVRKQSVAHLTRCIKTAAEAGAHLIAGPLFAPIGYLPGRRRNQDEWKWAVDTFQSLRDLLDANEMTLAIEPVNRSETFFLNTGSEAEAFCKEVDHARVGVTIDTFHANIEEKNIVAAVRALGNRLKHLHISENDRGLVGSGHVDFPGIVAALRQIAYNGCLMIEGFGYSPNEPESLGALWGDLNVTPEDVAFGGADYLRKLLAEAC